MVVTYYEHNSKRRAPPALDVIEFVPVDTGPSYVVTEAVTLDDVERFIKVYTAAGGTIP